MKSFDEVTQRLTEKLKVDPELRAEVRNELRGHLEESAREFVKGGRGEEEALSEAVRAMGDEREVAAGLWEGNRRRMVHRRVARWVVGGTLLSAAGVGTMVVAWGAVVSLAAILGMLAGMQPTTSGAFFSSLSQRVTAYARAERVARVSAKEREVFEAGEGSPEEKLEKGRRLAEGAVGEDRVVFWANYATQVMGVVEPMVGEAGGKERVMGAIEVMEKGKRVEPGNGYYAMLEAALLLEASTKDVDLAEDVGPGFDYVGRDGKRARYWFDRWEVTDAGMYERGIAQLREAAKCGELESHSVDFVKRRLKVLGTATRLADEVLRVREELAVSMPYLNAFRGVINAAQAREMELAKEHRTAEAIALLRDARRVSGMMAGRSHLLIEMLVGVGMYDLTLAQEAMVYQEAGETDQFKRSVTAMEAFGRDVPRGSRASGKAEEKIREQSGVIGNRFVYRSQINPALVDPTPERRAEYAVIDQLAISIWAGVLLLAVGWLGVRGLLRRVRTGVWPMMMFVGWGRMAQVVLMAVVVPVGVYVAYVAAWPMSGRGWGASEGGDRLAVEYAAVGCLIVVLLRVFGERALVQRAREIGVPIRRMQVGWGRCIVGGLLALMVVGFLVAWHWRMEFTWWVVFGQVGFLLAAVVAGYAGSWLSSGEDSSGGRLRLPWWVGPAAVGGMLALVVFIMDFHHSASSRRMMSEYAVGLCVAVTGLALVVLVFKLLGGRRGDLSAEMKEGWSLVPMMLAAGVVLVVVAGGTARVVERREVGRIEAAGGLLRMDQEVEHSIWKGMRERLGKENVTEGGKGV